MCSAAQRWKKIKYLLLSLNEAMDQFAMSNCVHRLWSCVEERGWSCHENDIRCLG